MKQRNILLLILIIVIIILIAFIKTLDNKIFPYNNINNEDYVQIIKMKGK